MLALELDRDPARREIEDVLRLKTLAELRNMARLISVPLKFKTKEEAVTYLVTALTDPDQIKPRLLALSKKERLLLDIIQLSGTPSGVSFQRLSEALKLLGLTEEPDSTGFALSELSGKGLLFFGGEVRSSQFNLVRVPQLVSAELSAQPVPFLTKPLGGRLEDLAIKDPPDPVDDELYFVWCYLEENPVTLLPVRDRNPFEERDGLKGWQNSPEEISWLELQPRRMSAAGFSLQVLPPPSPLPETHLRALAEKVSGGEAKVQFLYWLLQALNLIETEQRIAVRPGKMEDFLALPRTERLKAILIAWLRLGNWCETFLLLSCSPDIQVRRLLGQRPLKRLEFLDFLTDGQRLVVNAVARLEPENWCSRSDFLDALWALCPDFLVRPSFLTWHSVPWWFQPAASSAALDPHDRQAWRKAEGRYISRLLEGPLFWLGLVELAYSAGRLEAFRTTPNAKLLVGQLPSIASGVKDSGIEIGDDLSITLTPGAVDAEAHTFMKKLGSLMEATPKRFRYQLTADRVARVFEEGLDVSDIADFFARRNVSLPATMHQVLQDWWEKFGLIRLYDNLTVVEFADDYVLPELRATTSIDRQIIYEFSPRLVAIFPDSVDALIAELTRKGQTPKLVEGGS